jgi:hypothetical protein
MRAFETKRRGWDLNPRYLAVHRFSRHAEETAGKECNDKPQHDLRDGESERESFGCTDGCWIEFGPVDFASDLQFLLKSWPQLSEDARKRIRANVLVELETGSATVVDLPKMEDG